MVFEFIFDFHEWYASRRAGIWQARASQHKSTMDYWKTIAAGLHAFYNGQQKTDGPIPGMHEAKKQHDIAKAERDHCLAKAARWRS